MHLSNYKTVLAMIFYSVLTYFIGPLVTRPIVGPGVENCIVGFTLGFAVSVLLWSIFAKQLAY